ncbi:hypothetical protein ACHHYP_10566 [Achlya hypogyna]|uniref:SANT and BTB domain-containing protein n=1 Tax=Achlya hypogyna TaxID=1202772 RepID=A0A1V9YL77_ACHHY|nr:hypothetical protein ACHHYP_10566 [Achlya hypogyna]
MQRKSTSKGPQDSVTNKGLRTVRGSVDEKVEPSKVRKAKDETIVIHVCDEFRKVNKDFSCNKALLLENMRYFSAYLSDTNSHEDIDISVHCDVGIFEWLYNYIHAPQGVGTSPLTKLALDNVTPILISSDFLQMDFLVNECTTFIGVHLESVVDMPGDLLCVSEAILDSIALKCSLEQLDVIEPRKEKLCHKLYAKRLAALLANLKQLETGLDQCAACGVIHFSGHRPFLTCREATPSVGRHGQVVCRHEPRSDWKVDAWIKSLGVGPKTMYWKLWGALQCLYCVECRLFFAGSELKECVYHPPTTTDENRHGCCGAPKFAADARATRGCQSKYHTLGRPYELRGLYVSGSPLDRIHELALSHIDIIARDKPGPVPVPATGSGIHDMLRPCVVALKSMLVHVDVPSDLIKNLKSNTGDISTPQTRKQWKIDLYDCI